MCVNNNNNRIVKIKRGLHDEAQRVEQNKSSFKLLNMHNNNKNNNRK